MEKIIIEQTAGTWIFRITFLFNQNPVLCTEKGFKEVLERFDKGAGIKSVQHLSNDGKWVKMSKKQIRQHFSWDTETDLYLDQHYYFKTNRK